MATLLSKMLWTLMNDPASPHHFDDFVEEIDLARRKLRIVVIVVVTIMGIALVW